jgi:hypothetical protein
MLRLIMAAAILCVPALAFADATSDTQAAMNTYFDGEIRGGYILMGMGAGGLVAGGLMYRSSDLRLKGASYPLLGVGVLHLAAGIFVAVSSSSRVDQFTDDINKDTPGFVSRESKRMEGVSTQFTVLKIVETIIAVGGLTMAGIGWRTDRPRLMGAGLALAFEMGATFAFDVVAANRASDYRDRLSLVLTRQF